MGRSIRFYATRADLLGVLEQVESRYPLKYILHMRSNSPELEHYSQAAKVPKLGLRKTGLKYEALYAIANASDEVTVRKIPLDGGRCDYVLDFGPNPHWCQFSPSGKVNDSLLIAGEIATISTGANLSPLFKLLASEIKKQFEYVDMYWVGAEAIEMLHAGARLTEEVYSPQKHDLKRPRKKKTATAQK